MMKTIKIPEEYYVQIQEVLDYNNMNWIDAFETLVIKRDKLSELLRPLSVSEMISINVINKMHDTWVRNLKNNFDIIRESKNIREIPKMNSVLCIADGPSFHYELENGLRDKLYNFNGTIMCCEKNLMDLLRNDIVPDYFCSVDGDDIMATFIDDPLLDEHIDDMAGVFSVTCSNKLLNLWKGDKYFFTPYVDDPNLVRTLTRITYLLTNKSILHVGGNCGSTLWFISHASNANIIYLLGVDFAYKIGTPIKHDSTSKKTNGATYEYTNRYGIKVLTEFVFEKSFKYALESWIKNTKNTTYQCGKYSIVDCVDYMKLEDIR